MNHENQLERNLLVNVDGIQLVANLVSGNVDKKQNTSNIDKRNQRQPQWNNQQQNNGNRGNETITMKIEEEEEDFGIISNINIKFETNLVTQL